jgi:hypothetical protein
MRVAENGRDTLRLVSARKTADLNLRRTQGTGDRCALHASPAMAQRLQIFGRTELRVDSTDEPAQRRCGPLARRAAMRKPYDPEPRLVALTQADIDAQRESRTWMPANSRATLDPARWSQRARQDSRWRMVEIWNEARLLN